MREAERPALVGMAFHADIALELIVHRAMRVVTVGAGESFLRDRVMIRESEFTARIFVASEASFFRRLAHQVSMREQVRRVCGFIARLLHLCGGLSLRLHHLCMARDTTDTRTVVVAELPFRRRESRVMATQTSLAVVRGLAQWFRGFRRGIIDMVRAGTMASFAEIPLSLRFACDHPQPMGLLVELAAGFIMAPFTGFAADEFRRRRFRLLA